MKGHETVKGSLVTLVLALTALAFGCGGTETLFGAGGSAATSTGTGNGGSNPCPGGHSTGKTRGTRYFPQ
jgi:hypothetical protein